MEQENCNIDINFLEISGLNRIKSFLVIDDESSINESFKWYKGVLTNIYGGFVVKKDNNFTDSYY